MSDIPCYTGPPGTEGVGICHGGWMACDPEGIGYSVCTGVVVPDDELCGTPEDEDCDGETNEASDGCVCVPFSTTPCPYPGPAGTDGVGIYQHGVKLCTSDGKGYNACIGQMLPKAETCLTPEDDDCDGSTNEDGDGCICVPNAVVSCYSGPVGTDGVGICVGGLKTCNEQGTAYSGCLGESRATGMGPEVLPTAETCNSPTEIPADEDCDGQVNEGVCKVVAIATGEFHAFALRSDGTVWAWGESGFGELGDNQPQRSDRSHEPVLHGIRRVWPDGHISTAAGNCRG